jgi:hypothetical protein
MKDSNENERREEVEEREGNDSLLSPNKWFKLS